MKRHQALNKSIQILLDKIPPTARQEVLKLFNSHAVSLHFSKARLTKWGHFKASRSGGGIPQISLNIDLSPQAMLLTFVHEWAHLLVWKTGKKVAPHGALWKICFRDTMIPFLNENNFQNSLLPKIDRYLRNPSAAITSAPELYNALIEKQDSTCLVSEIPFGGTFVFRNKQYKRFEKKRTRFRCTQSLTNKQYLFQEATPVYPY